MPNRRAILPARLWGPPVEWDASIVDRFFPLPTKPNWAGGFDIWNPGEEGALKRLLEWDAEITPEHYGQFRGYPSDAVTSRMSPHIHFGEISPLQIAAVLHHAHPMINELQWREYKHDSYARLPEYRDIEYRGYCRGYKWGNDIALFDAWCKGETGYRVVDAGMQELWATGYMNNRVRMVVSSFLVKLLDIDWRWGQAWFEDTLCDADHAINSQSWQDTMGASHDSKPYPIILNPLLQYEKFGMKAYCDKWAPGYVKPIIDYAVARKHAEDKWTRHKITLA
jgi:deoxyribodipyrimidine photo-lyase